MKIKIKTIRLAENCLILLLLLFLIISCKKENTELLKNRSTEESKQDIQKQNDPVSDQLTITEVENFILKWCSYQTNYNIQAYLNCYSPEFLGVKKTNSGKQYIYNYSDWAKDRTKMYQTARDLNVSAAELKIKSFSEKDGLTIIEFEQYYLSRKYNDHGRKIMKLKRNSNNEIKIHFEELENSYQIGD